MANTFELIASSTVGVLGSLSIDFTSIPSTYTDLCLKVSSRIDLDYNTVNITINGVSTNQTVRRLAGSGSAASSSTYNELQTEPSTYTANTFASAELYFPNYAGSTNKSFSIDVVTENNATLSYAMLEAWLWSQTTAISSIGLSARLGSKFSQYSTAYLYGVKNA